MESESSPYHCLTISAFLLFLKSTILRPFADDEDELFTFFYHSLPQVRNDGNKSQTVIIVVPIIAFVMLIIISCIYLRVRKPGKKPESEAVDEIESLESLQFDFDTVKVATDDFSDANKLGQGGFGVVYKLVGINMKDGEFKGREELSPIE
ncbi:cysteine-rich receptor-like protein kinase 27 [Quercus suber]|uniref:Cysteine-rich receptor-like protein kinase 27 n=1 Tax=Quercus suber TaxID=58331 RepID=A0AAW0KHQ0_QUESU